MLHVILVCDTEFRLISDYCRHWHYSADIWWLAVKYCHFTCYWYGKNKKIYVRFIHMQITNTNKSLSIVSKILWKIHLHVAE